MKRKLTALITCVLLLLTLPMAVFADELPMVVDNAGLLTAEEAASLNTKALALREEYEMDIVILTVDALDGKRPQDYADDFFDYGGYGYGDDYSGILLLLSMENRDWYIFTSGDGIYALTDYSIQACMEEPLSYMGQGDFYGGFNAWLDGLPVYLESFHNDAPIDGQADYSEDYYHGDREGVVYYHEEKAPNLFLSLIIGLAVAGISVLVMRASMNTKRSQRGAASYLVEDSFHLRTHQDIFLYSNIQKTPRPKQTSSGGGSSVHHSSSGRSHGGGGGKF